MNLVLNTVHMTNDIILDEINASYIKVTCEKSIEAELHDFFTFDVPNSQYDPRVRARQWDGKKHLYNKKTKQIYRGLLPRITQWAEEHGYNWKYNHAVPLHIRQIPKDFVEELDLPTHIKDRWYQYDSFENAVLKNRCITLLSTAGGKSLILYMLTRFYNKKTLILVNTLGLVTQMYKHFKEYGYDVETNMHCVFGGTDKTSTKPVCISTWQSVYEEGPEFFDDYEVVIGDEVHLFAAKSLQTILTNCRNAYHRFGFTGTLQESKCHHLVLEGLFGSVFSPSSTRELADQGFIAHPKVNILIFGYPMKYRQFMHKGSKYGYKPIDYAQEMDFICRIPQRNKYIANLANNLKGNVLILFRFCDKHGKPLFDMMEGTTNGRMLHYVDGGTEKEDRECVRQFVIENGNTISICSYGVFSTGIDIPNLNHIIFASPYKSKIKILQSIGRGLRLSTGKTHCEIYDLVDDLSIRNVNNHVLNHYLERIRYYNEEEFPYQQYRIEL